MNFDIETYYKIICPNCKIVNWICGGDKTDITGFDPEGFTCFSCHQSYAFNDGENYEDVTLCDGISTQKMFSETFSDILD